MSLFIYLAATFIVFGVAYVAFSPMNGAGGCMEQFVTMLGVKLHHLRAARCGIHLNGVNSSTSTCSKFNMTLFVVESYFETVSSC